MKALVLGFLLVFLLVLPSACGRQLAPPAAPASTAGPDPALFETYRQKALDHEKQGALPEALLAWRVAALLDPGNTMAPRVIATLERGIKKAAQVHFERAQAHYRAGRHEAAAREFLITLRLAPDHHRAAYYLRSVQRRAPGDYTVRPGDSFSRIALSAYGDANLGNLIAYYNDLDPRKPLHIGKTLQLPALERTGTPPRNDQRTLLEEAAQALTQRRYRDVIDIAARIEPGTDYHGQAVRMADDAHYRWGSELCAQSQYLAALEQFKQLGEGYEGRSEAIAMARKQLQREDTAARLAAADAFMKQKAHARAVNALEEILAREPGHAEAGVMLQSARYALGRSLLDAQREPEALKVFSALDPDYQDTAQWAALARARLTARAETLYRKGVKHFLVEELESAVACWEQTLALNPEHPKARQDIENALRLLDRWRGLKKE